ncbi:MAG: ATP-grasp domain-containing protein [Chitinispirillaceae bacterium]|nr:ATP-grasp domain-containing protein [Chitinispirillaceae bacterium]
MLEKKTVLVLDGETRAALAVVRSLGRAGLKVIVASEDKRSLAGSSKYCDHTVCNPSPAVDIHCFVETVRKIIIQEQVDVLFPVTDASTYAILQNRDIFDAIVSLPLVPFHTYWAASNKISLMKRAAQSGVPIPETIFIDPASDELQQHLQNITYPVILKPRASILLSGNSMRKTGVRFANCKEELQIVITTDPSFTAPYMLQKLIAGDGIGIFAFCENGDITSVFSHHRIREKPPYGGISVVCESTQPDQLALESSKKLLKALNWNGIAMVEFKRDRNRNNIPVLMEINARFWGSLQLAIDAGVDFPLYMYNLSQKTELRNNKHEEIVDFPITAGEVQHLDPPSIKQTRSRWLLGDLDHLIIRLKMPVDHPRYPQKLRDKLHAIFIFFLEFFKGSKIEELRYGDSRPFWHSLAKWVKAQNI